MPSQLINRYIRTETLPHIWCPGCGHGILMHDIVQAIDNLQLDQDKVCIVSGIGCSSRAAGYMNFNTIHTTHGRAIAFATGIKLAKPEMEVIVVTGDGDASAIGGNHLIHAARRNIGLTVIVFNNNIYGMTGGQYSPTTPNGSFGTTAPYGNVDRPFDIASLAIGAGASYVARGTAFHTTQTIKLIEQGIRHKGFSLIDCYSVCPTYYGRKNKKGDSVEMLKWQKEYGNTAEKAASTAKEKLKDKFIVGVLYHDNYPEYTSEYQKIIDKCHHY